MSRLAPHRRWLLFTDAAHLATSSKHFVHGAVASEGTSSPPAMALPIFMPASIDCLASKGRTRHSAGVCTDVRVKCVCIYLDA
jgi:hypothetical protein